MPGGSDESWVTLGPILRSIAAVAEGEPCVTHVGHDGAGHFVKMVHNGIEYADMQLIAEAYDLIRRGTGKTPEQIADVFAEWNRGELESYLIEITAEVLRQQDAETGRALVDVVVDQAGAKGTGGWTVQTAISLGVPHPGSRRPSSPGRSRRTPSSAPSRAHSPVLTHRRSTPTPTRSSRTCGSHSTRRRSSRTPRASTSSAPAPRSTGGTSTSVRCPASGARGASSAPQFLNRIAEAYGENPGLEVLLTAPYFVDALTRAQGAWRRIVARTAEAGIPSPAFASSLAYYDGLRAERLPLRSSRASATSSAPTPTAASTRTARSTPSGRATAPRSRPSTPH